MDNQSLPSAEVREGQEDGKGANKKKFYGEKNVRKSEETQGERWVAGTNERGRQMRRE